MKEKLFPNFICRVSGLPTEKITNLSSDKLKLIVEDIFKIDKEIDKIKANISDQLFSVVQEQPDKKSRNKIIKLRRDIYNKKNIEILHIQDMFGNYPQIWQLLKEYNKLFNLKERTFSRYQRVFQQELLRIRNNLKHQIADEYFQKGLLLSSDSLFNSQGYYINTDSASLNGKQEQIERGLLRYYSRMAMKATPFGTFCSIIPGVIEEDLPFDYQFTSDPYIKRSIVLLNKWIYGVLTRFITSSKELKPYINLELNPTIEKKENQLVFLTSINESEIFQHIEINEVIELLYKQLKKYSEISYGTLIKDIGSIEDIDASEGEIRVYLDKLIDLGLLRYKFGIANQEEDWDILLLKVIDKIPGEKSNIIIEFLSQLRHKKTVFAKSSLRIRNIILDEIKKLIKKTLSKLEIEEKVRNDLPLYEDSTSNTILKLNSKLFESSIPKITGLLTNLRQVAYPRKDNISMRYFYDTYYQDKSSSIKLLDFYEDYYREHFKQHLEKEQKLKMNIDKEELKKYNLSNPFELESIKKIHGFWSSFHSLIIQKWMDNQNAEQINILESEIKKICPDISPVVSPRHSVSSFGEWVLSENDIGEVQIIYPCARSMLGFGKYFSRFLKLFDVEHQKQIYENNVYNGDILFAEICDDGNFNGNLHPPLTEYEISYPTGEGGNSPKKIAASEIIVAPADDDQQALYLYRSTDGKRIIPLDLGFLNPNMRPPLYQLIAKFTVPVNCSLILPSHPIIWENSKGLKKPDLGNNNLEEESKQEKSTNKRGKIVHCPRVLYEGEIILGRECWTISAELFPYRNTNETNEEYFLRLNLWRISNNIPTEVYVRINPLFFQNKNVMRSNAIEQKKEILLMDDNHRVEGITKIDNEIKKTPKTLEGKEKLGKTAQRKSRDYYKPQYIDFSSPLFCNLFGKMSVNLQNFTMNIEERLPKKNQLLKYGNKSYTTEFIFQLDFFEDENKETDIIDEENLIGVK